MKSVIIGAVVGWFAGAIVALVFVDGPPVGPRHQVGWAVCLCAGAFVGGLIGAFYCRDVVVERVIMGALKGCGLGIAGFLLFRGFCTVELAEDLATFIAVILASLSTIGGLLGGTRAIIAAIDKTISGQSSTAKPNE